jgi:hypothetical protein
MCQQKSYKAKIIETAPEHKAKPQIHRQTKTHKNETKEKVQNNNNYYYYYKFYLATVTKVCLCSIFNYITVDSGTIYIFNE